MSKKILRYSLAVQGEQQIQMPSGAVVLSAGLTPRGEVSVWALGDSDDVATARTFYVVGTGAESPLWHEVERAAFVGTVVQPAMNAVWHVFQEGS